VWQKQRTKVTQTDEMALLQDVSENSEICYAKYNKATGVFENQDFITNNRVLDMYPTIAVDGDDIAVLWVSNDASDAFGIEGVYSILRSNLIDGVFSPSVKLHETELYISELAAGFVDGELEVIFAAGSSAEETEGYILTAGRAMQFTDHNPAIAFKYHDGLFYWHSLGSVYTFNPITRVAARVEIPDVNAVSSSYRIIKADNKDAIIWINNAGEEYTINAAMHLGDGIWSLPITLLTVEDEAIWFADAAVSDNGSWNIIMNTIKPDTEMSSLVFSAVSPKTETELVYAYANQRESINGLQPIHISVMNLGETTIEELNVNIECSKTSYLKEKLVFNIKPGHTEGFTVYIDTSGLNAVTEMTVSVFSDSEFDTSNNNAQLLLGEVDVSVDLTPYQLDDVVLVAAQISNKSATPANVTLSIIEGSLNGNVIKAEELGVTNQNEDRLFTHWINLNDVDFGEETSKAIFFKVDTLEPNYSEFNSYELIILYKPEKYEIIDLPVKEITIIHADSVSIDHEEVHLKLDDENLNEFPLSATVLPEEAMNRNVRWVVENADIAHVDSFGIIRGLSVGETMLTAITYDGEFTDAIKVVVTADEAAQYRLTVMASEGGRIVENPSGYYKADDIIDLSAVADGYYVFKNWESSNAGDFDNAFSANTAFTMPANDVTIIVYFILNRVSNYKVTGEISSFNPNNPITIRLIQNDGENEYTEIIKAEAGNGQRNQKFTFNNVEPGTYTLIITKDAHLKYTLLKVVIDEDLDLTRDSREDIKLMTLKCGDLNKDGQINSGDLLILLGRYLDQGDNILVDLNGDGQVNSSDLLILLGNYLELDVEVDYGITM